MTTSNSLNNNHLSPEFADSLNGLITNLERYVSITPEVKSLIPVVEKIRGMFPEMKIENSSKFITKNGVLFDPFIKTFKIGELSDEVDVKHLFIKELVRANSSTENNALKEGFSSLVATNAIGNESKSNIYFDEEVAVNLLKEIVGFEPTYEYIVNNNKSILTVLKNMGIEEKEFHDLLSIIEHNYEIKKTTNISNIGEIQNRLIKMFAKTPNLTKNEIENFKLQLCTKKEYLNNNVCKNLHTVDLTFSQAFENYEFQTEKTK